MLIKVILKSGVEGLFNTDCQIAYLLDAIKEKHGLPKTDEIDLCSLEGEVKNLHLHRSENGTSFFEKREMCLAVLVSEVDGHPFYTPVLSEYASDEHFVGILNHKNGPTTVRLRGRKQPSSHRMSTPVQSTTLRDRSGVKKKGKPSMTRMN